MKFTPARIGLLLFLLGYLLFLNVNLESDLGYDEARHASQGHFFYDYVQSLADGKFVLVKEFMRQYAQKHYTIGWYALYDPPVHAISQAFVFTVLGASSFAARFTTMIWVILGSFLLFLLAKSVFKDERWALLSVVLFLLTPISYYFSRQSMLTMPIAVMVIGWYYFSFHSDHKYHWIWSSLCLIAAGLMKYQTMIYFAVFALVYVIIYLVQTLKQKKGSLLNIFTDHQPIRLFLIQSALFLLAFFPWFWISLRNTDVVGKLLAAGTQEIKGGVVGTLGYYFSFITQAVVETNGLVLLALFLLCFSMGRSFLKKHWPMGLYVLTTFITASILISNKQFRYMIHVLPFLIIFVVEVLRQGWMLCSLRLPQAKPVCWIALGVLCGGLLVVDIGVGQQFAYESGIAQDDVYEWVEQQNLPRIVILAGLDYEETTFDSQFYHSEDLFVFRTMMLMDHHDPSFMRQSLARLSLDDLADVYKLILFFDLSNETHTHLLLMHRPSFHSSLGSQARTLLEQHGFELVEFEEYVGFIRTAPPSRFSGPVFPTLAQKTSSLEHFDAGTKALKKSDFIAAQEEFMTTYRRNPLHFASLTNAAEALHSYSQTLLAQEQELEAIKILHEAVELDPTHQKSRQGLINIYVELAKRSAELGNEESVQKFKMQASALTQSNPLILSGSLVSLKSDQEQKTS